MALTGLEEWCTFNWDTSKNWVDWKMTFFYQGGLRGWARSLFLRHTLTRSSNHPKVYYQERLNSPSGRPSHMYHRPYRVRTFWSLNLSTGTQKAQKSTQPVCCTFKSGDRLQVRSPSHGPFLDATPGGHPVSTRAKRSKNIDIYQDTRARGV